MGWMRLIHFSAGYVFAMGVLLRIYWGFVGNRYARWSAMIPYTGNASGNFTTTFGSISCWIPVRLSSWAIRYSPGYRTWCSFLGYLVSILTGFALMSQSHVGLFWKVVGGWILPYFPVQEVRLVHHFIMWFLIVFPIVHMYIGWTTDLVEDNCVMSSIF